MAVAGNDNCFGSAWALSHESLTVASSALPYWKQKKNCPTPVHLDINTARADQAAAVGDHTSPPPPPTPPTSMGGGAAIIGRDKHSTLTHRIALPPPPLPTHLHSHPFISCFRQGMPLFCL